MSNNNQWVPVCDASDLTSNIGICAKVDNKQVAIFKLEAAGEIKLYGIDNHDPFSGSNVLSRGLVGDLKGQDVVASPIYKQHYNLETGQCLEDDDVKLTVYSVRDNAGKIEIAA
ncbi:nitrite reductase small subunit [Gammaproteobacteria bacterium 45_16_T64]|nr:nitrite reductase small subunit [Gammaproteobacteria bacterium 45_16_T64]